MHHHSNRTDQEGVVSLHRLGGRVTPERTLQEGATSGNGCHPSHDLVRALVCNVFHDVACNESPLMRRREFVRSFTPTFESINMSFCCFSFAIVYFVSLDALFLGGKDRAAITRSDGTGIGIRYRSCSIPLCARMKAMRNPYPR